MITQRLTPLQRGKHSQLRVFVERAVGIGELENDIGQRTFHRGHWASPGFGRSVREGTDIRRLFYKSVYRLRVCARGILEGKAAEALRYIVASGEVDRLHRFAGCMSIRNAHNRFRIIPTVIGHSGVVTDCISTRKFLATMLRTLLKPCRPIHGVESESRARGEDRSTAPTYPLR